MHAARHAAMRAPRAARWWLVLFAALASAHDCPLLAGNPFSVRAVKKSEWTADIFFSKWPAQYLVTLAFVVPTTLMFANHADIVSEDSRRTTLLMQKAGPEDGIARLMLHIRGSHTSIPDITCEYVLGDDKEPKKDLLGKVISEAPRADIHKAGATTNPEISAQTLPTTQASVTGTAAVPLSSSYPLHPPKPNGPPHPSSPPPCPVAPPPLPPPPNGVSIGKIPTSLELQLVNVSMQSSYKVLGREDMFAPDKCMDGISNSSDGEANFCMSRPGVRNPWLSVELAPGSVVGEVLVYNRADCCQEALSPLLIWVANEPGIPEELELCGDEFSLPPSVDLFSVLCGGIEGRFVTIMLPGEARTLHVAEVRIFNLGSPPPRAPPLAPFPSPFVPRPLMPPPSTPPGFPSPIPASPPFPYSPPHVPRPIAPPSEPPKQSPFPPPPYTTPPPLHHLILNNNIESRVFLTHNKLSSIVMDIMTTLNGSLTVEEGDWATFVPVVVGSCSGATWLGAAFGGALDSKLIVSVMLPATTPDAAQNSDENGDAESEDSLSLEDATSTRGVYALCLARGPYSKRSSGPKHDSDFHFYPEVTVQVSFAPPSPLLPPSPGRPPPSPGRPPPSPVRPPPYPPKLTPPGNPAKEPEFAKIVQNNVEAEEHHSSFNSVMEPIISSSEDVLSHLQSLVPSSVGEDMQWDEPTALYVLAGIFISFGFLGATTGRLIHLYRAKMVGQRIERRIGPHRTPRGLQRQYNSLRCAPEPSRFAEHGEDIPSPTGSDVSL